MKMTYLFTHSDFLASHITEQYQDVYKESCTICKAWQNGEALIEQIQEISSKENNALYIIDVDSAPSTLQTIESDEFPALTLFIYSDKIEEMGILKAFSSSQLLKRPFALSDLILNIDQIKSKSVGHAQSEMMIGSLIFNMAQKEIYQKSQLENIIKLTEKERDILQFLALAKGEFVTRETLLEEVFNYHKSVDTHTLGSHIYRLRQKLASIENGENLIESEAGGYRLNYSAINS